MVRRLGFGVVRLTDRDLRDPEVRAQAERLTSEERLLLVRLAGQPSDDLLQLLQRLRRVIMAVEVLLPEDEIAGWRAAPPPLGVPVRLAPLGQGARTPVASAEVPEGAGAGFRVLELERLTGLDLQADGVFAGIVARLDRDQPVFRTLLRAVAAVSARELELSFDLDRSLAVEDERRLEGRAAEAAFAANALPDAEIVLGGLLELDGNAGSTAAGQAITTVGTLPPLRPGGFAWSITQRGGPTIHGYESEIG
ncbi:MAG: hypothetical protein R3349_12895, partial [Geminicoccaceae bacterium]|nr:hypothetical protein [Geminicoccaceae bacterium]